VRGVSFILTAFLMMACAAAGCARALREPPPLGDLAGAKPRAPAEAVGSLLARGEFLYAGRTLESVRQAAEVYLEAAQADRGRAEGLVGAARARVWLADHETSAAERERAAEGAVHAAQWCVRYASESPSCSYWLGAALGVQARERRTTALDALPKIVEAFQRAAALEPSLDEGGPDRALALVYARAPGWPTGPGDPDLALEHAREAVAINPGYPPNQIALAEALAATGDREGSVRTYRRVLDLGREYAARGDPDAAEWVLEAEQALGMRR